MTDPSTVCPELVAALAAVAETTVAGGGPKYGPGTIAQLERTILARAYGPPIHELCHLVVIGAACDLRHGRYETLFYLDEPARPAVFRAYLLSALRNGVARPKPAASSVVVATDGEPFQVHYSRMPLLSALAEFLFDTLGYAAIDAVLADIVALPTRQRRVADAANTLSRALYAWLQRCLSSGHSQRKMRLMVDHLATRGRAEAAAIDDEAILGFWLAWSAHNDTVEGFRTYDKVVESFLDLHASLSAGEEGDRIRAARPIGPDRDAGEVDPVDVEAALAALDEQAEPVEALKAPPLARVKFCTKKELDDLATPALFGRLARRLALTALRYDVFGDVQGRITQALRSRLTWRSEPKAGYATRLDDYRQLGSRLERMLWASLHVLIRLRTPAVIELVQALRPELDLTALVPAAPDRPEDGVTRLHPVASAERFLRLLDADPAALGAEVAALAEQARRAYAGNARKGFAADEMADPEVVEAFEAAAPTLRRLADRLTQFNAALAATADATWAERYAVDGPVFAAQFEQIYGGPGS